MPCAGRAGQRGVSMTYFTEGSHRLAPELLSLLQEAGQPVPAELERIAAQPRKPTSRERYVQYLEVRH